MDFLLYSKTGDGVGLLLKLMDEGHDVAIAIKEGYAKQTGRGLIPRLQRLPKKGDIVLFDFTGLRPSVSNLESAGILAIGGGSAEADKLENNRMYGLNTMKKIGIDVPGSYSFTNMDSAISFAKKSVTPWVIKPHGNTAFTTLTSDPVETIKTLELLKERATKGVLLQEVKKGFEISTECWVHKGALIPNSFTHTIEEKKFLAGNLGPQIGCAGSLVFKAREFPWMKQIGNYLGSYTGPVDLNCIVDEKGTWWGLEWTPRFGYSAIYCLCLLLNKPLSETLKSLEFDLSDKFASSIRVSIPPYPLESDRYSAPFQDTKGTPIRGFSESVFLLDFVVKNGEVLSGGVDGVIGEAVGYGKTPGEAHRYALEACRKLKVTNLQYREDTNRRFSELSLKAENLGLSYLFPHDSQDAKRPVAALNKSKPNTATNRLV